MISRHRDHLGLTPRPVIPKLELDRRFGMDGQLSRIGQPDLVPPEVYHTGEA